MIIDSYSEHVLNPKQQNAVGTLPKGLSREEFILRLNVLIGETLPEMTNYTEVEYRSGKALLLLVNKYCFDMKKSFGNAPRSHQFNEYLDLTKKMLDDEIKRMTVNASGIVPVLDFDKAFTIISNAMQLLTSVITYQELQKEKEKSRSQPAVLGIILPFGGNTPAMAIEFARDNTAIGDVVTYLDNTWLITKNYQRAKALLKFQSEAFVEWNEFKYLRMILEITKMRLDEIGVF